MKISQNRLIVHFKIIWKQYSVFKNMRNFFISKRFELHEKYRIQNAAANKIQRKTIDLACILSQIKFETINKTIDRVRDKKQTLNNVAANVSLNSLQKLIWKELIDVQMKFRTIKNVLQKMKRNMRKISQFLKIIKQIYDEIQHVLFINVFWCHLKILNNDYDGVNLLNCWVFCWRNNVTSQSTIHLLISDVKTWKKCKHPKL